ncbi:hypothetical protein [Marinisporobacter balticus]|uniref:Lipoprotein n=1 Tax=Marinisporobacter balticus TaxID=2018667 RepID=A0A4R2KF33_9FIRM|nr:hypothetical protein [Marinisporobacter balticus]TCO72163.1 hypothetical protein EV214_11926 [Marinisporobacter balticus]
MRKLFCSIAFVLILLLPGCTSMGLVQSNTSVKAPDSNVLSQTTFASDNLSNTLSNQTIKNIDTSKIQGKIKNVYYIEKNKILILADNLYLYDLFTGKVLNQTEKVDFDLEEYHVIDNGIAVIGISYDISDEDGSSGFGISDGAFRDSYVINIYDLELNKLNEISINKLMGEDEFVGDTEQMSVSKDGRKIAFATLDGLFLYDINSKTKTTLVDLLDENRSKRSGLVGFDQVAFVQNDNIIAFKSKSLDVPPVYGKSSFDTYGTINIDGSGLLVKRSTNYSVKQLIPYNAFGFLAEDFTVPSGNLMVFDFNSGESKILKTKTQKESGTVFGSEDGQFFATSTFDKNNFEVRVYDAEKGSMVMEKVIDADPNVACEPEVRVIDELRICIVLVANRQTDLSTQCLVFSF